MIKEKEVITVCADFDKRLDTAWYKLHQRIVERNEGISQYDADEIAVECIEACAINMTTKASSPRPRRCCVKVWFADGNNFISTINLSYKEACDYYMNQGFELDEDKPLMKAIRVDLLN